MFLIIWIWPLAFYTNLSMWFNGRMHFITRVVHVLCSNPMSLSLLGKLTPPCWERLLLLDFAFAHSLRILALSCRQSSIKCPLKMVQLKVDRRVMERKQMMKQALAIQSTTLFFCRLTGLEIHNAFLILFELSFLFWNDRCY